jgi:hypothetical protein
MVVSARSVSTLGLIFAWLLHGCATAPEAREAKLQQRTERAAVELERRSDADSLAVAGLLRSWEGKPAPAVDVLSRATALAPERSDLAWLDIQICAAAPNCDSEPEERRLRSLDPSNGAGWLQALSRANATDDQAARNAILSALARTERVDVYWTSLIVHLTRALVDTHQIPMREALVEVIGVLSARAIPAYRPTSSLCKAERLNSAQALGDCRALALALEHGDTYLTELLGVAIAERVWPADSPEWKAAAEARRVYQYRSEISLHSAMNSLSDAGSAAKFLELCARNRREQDLLRAELIEEGKTPDPPSGWIPSASRP